MDDSTAPGTPTMKAGVIGLLLACAVLAGCHNLGPRAVREGRNDYNEAVNNSAIEELLLNIVRLRHTASPHALQVATITSRVEIEAGAGIDQGEDLALLRYAERPTIVYTPLTGEEFVRQLLTRIDLDTLYLMYGAGWEIDDIFRVFVTRINGLENAVIGSGPTPEGTPVYKDFLRLADAFDTLDDAGVISLTRSAAKPDELVMYFYDHEDPQISSMIDRVSSALRLDPDKKAYRVRLGIEEGERNEIVIETRPLVSAMFFLGHSAEIPQTLIDENRVYVHRDRDGRPVDWSPVTEGLFSLRSSRRRPRDAFVSTRYRGYWYYIDGTDIDSRETLAMLNTVLVLKAGGQAGVGPTLTLPVD